ncbi:SURF1 family protein [Halomonas daqingensis]|uniref:SURF1-like protein n=1 Tax=Billgrantia desiderata TaxID=52021 RepID=A0ABS9B0S6_9GAMM|nr:SURF1 family protein [Halomonas desiderata]MCE8040799.1 SURF1 family protein [Halomonas desiderata]MCE8045374.1 SURF1 family protein [Halomonas desiderata]
MGHSIGSQGGGKWRLRLWFSFWSALVALGLFLGLWQWERADDKREYLARLDAAPTLQAPIETPPEGTRLTLRGRYLEEQTLFLDNRTHQGQLGVAVLTPLRTEDGRLWLVQRGFLPTGPSREAPEVETPVDEVVVAGRWQAAGSGTPLFGPNREGSRLQRIELEAWEADFAHAGWMHLERGAGLLEPWWQPSVMPPSRHVGYAVQWWGLALAALVVMLLGGRRLIRDRRAAATTAGRNAHEEAKPCRKP